MLKFEICDGNLVYLTNGSKYYDFSGKNHEKHQKIDKKPRNRNLKIMGGNGEWNVKSVQLNRFA